MNKCGACKKFMSPKAADGVTCAIADCATIYHRDCVGLSTKLVLTKPWTCTSCMAKKPRNNANSTPVRTVDSAEFLGQNRDQHAPTSPKADIASTNATGTEFANLSKILEELQKFRTDLNALRSDFTGFRSEIRELSSSLKSCCLRVDKVEDRMETLEKRMESFGEADIEEISKLKNTISTLENQINDREQQSLSNDIEISGIPEGSGENVIHIATLIASKLGMTLEERDVVHAYRKGTKREGKPSRPRTISVRFVRQNVRDKFLKNARVRRRTTTENMNLPGEPTIFYVNERLTKMNQTLFQKAREIGKQKNWKYIWTQNGHVLARKEEGKAVHRISNLDAVDKTFGL